MLRLKQKHQTLIALMLLLHFRRCCLHPRCPTQSAEPVRSSDMLHLYRLRGENKPCASAGAKLDKLADPCLGADAMDLAH